MPQKKVIARKRGASRMFQLGKKLVQFWLDPAELLMVKAAFPHQAPSQAARLTLLEECRQRGQYHHMHVEAARKLPAQGGKDQ